MSTNYSGPGDRLTVTAPAAVSAGDLVKVGYLFGVALNDAASGASVVIAREGVFTLPKVTHASSQAFTQGALAYWNVSEGKVTATSSGNLQIGWAAEDIVSTATTGKFVLAGFGIG